MFFGTLRKCRSYPILNSLLDNSAKFEQGASFAVAFYTKIPKKIVSFGDFCNYMDNIENLPVHGNPTVEVDICCSNGVFARVVVPSDASTGVYKALELRDGGSYYLGKGVSKAVKNVNSIIGPVIIGKDPIDQTSLDKFMVHELDGTQNEWGWCKQKLGANAMLVVSLTVCKTGAAVRNVPLYKHIADLAGNKKLILPILPSM